MKFFHRWMARKLQWYWNNSERLLSDGDNDIVYAKNSVSPSPSRLLRQTVSNDSQLRGNPVEMKIHMANGGYVIEFYKYDHIKDRSSIETYVIDDNVDKLGENIAQIVVQYTIQNR